MGRVMRVKTGLQHLDLSKAVLDVEVSNSSSAGENTNRAVSAQKGDKSCFVFTKTRMNNVADQIALYDDSGSLVWAVAAKEILGGVNALFVGIGSYSISDNIILVVAHDHILDQWSLVSINTLTGNHTVVNQVSTPLTSPLGGISDPVAYSRVGNTLTMFLSAGGDGIRAYGIDITTGVFTDVVISNFVTNYGEHIYVLTGEAGTSNPFTTLGLVDFTNTTSAIRLKPVITESMVLGHTVPKPSSYGRPAFFARWGDVLFLMNANAAWSHFDPYETYIQLNKVLVAAGVSTPVWELQ